MRGVLLHGVVTYISSKHFKVAVHGASAILVYNLFGTTECQAMISTESLESKLVNSVSK